MTHHQNPHQRTIPPDHGRQLVKFHFKYVGFAFRLAIAKLRYRSRLHLRSLEFSMERDVELNIDGKSTVECGRRAYLRKGTVADAREGSVLRIGSFVFVNRGCSLVARYGIEIGDETLLGEYVTIYDHNHNYDSAATGELRDQGYRGGPISIGRNCWIGSHSFIGAGVSVGDNCVIGAHTVVTRSIPANSLVYGKLQLVIEPRGMEQR
jgi:acetyltransferase-like isoleucine patch superfamily enzyme